MCAVGKYRGGAVLVFTALPADMRSPAPKVDAVLGNRPRLEADARGARAKSCRFRGPHFLQRYFDLHGVTLPPRACIIGSFGKLEAPLIEIGLDATAKCRRNVPDLAGINRNTLRKKDQPTSIVARDTRRKLM